MSGRDGLHPSPRVVIFDNDGTLVPSHETANPAIQRGFAQFCRERGLLWDPPSDERLRELTGQPGDAFFRALLPEEWRQAAAELRAVCLEEEVAAMRASARFYPGIEATLVRLRAAGKRLAVATHGGERYIGAVSARLGYERIFDRVLYHGFDGVVSKGAMARRILSEIGPGPAAFVGDRRADAEAASEAGIAFVGCRYGYGAVGELAGAAAIASRPQDLAAILLDGAG